ncbi:uncharacterized protein LOC133366793 [Rhineura floridana]|uniref:uncharacterized protein LOC133366793 n=1 Tax=Rhineura floridana TaxID=261503 RepID=UPI002AC8816C|nr:uncharacterized protein LOC133366793 [Rhineura floridana]
MGEPSFHCHPAPEGCCLQLHETVVILVALIILVHLALKLAAVLGTSSLPNKKRGRGGAPSKLLWKCFVPRNVGRFERLLHSLLLLLLLLPEPEKGKIIVPGKVKAARALRSPSTQWSEEPDAPCPRRPQQQQQPGRRRRESSSPQRRCLHCTLEPLKVTMDLRSNEERFPLCREDHRRLGRRPCPDCPPCHHPPRYYNCDCESKPPQQPRPRTASAPSAYTVTRCRDVACGSSDPMLAADGNEHRASVGVGTADCYPRAPQTGPEAQFRALVTADQEIEYNAGITPRSRRPPKVYIYPVHPQTPPGSRSASPERNFRRRGTVAPVALEEPQDYEVRQPPPRRKARDSDQPVSLPVPAPRFHSASSSAPGQGVQTEAPNVKPQAIGASDWVYHPLK